MNLVHSIFKYVFVFCLVTPYVCIFSAETGDVTAGIVSTNVQFYEMASKQKSIISESDEAKRVIPTGAVTRYSGRYGSPFYASDESFETTLNSAASAGELDRVRLLLQFCPFTYE